MSVPRDTGGPAFPRRTHMLLNGGYEWGAEGMSLLDYFAAQALIGLIINPATVCVSTPVSARAYELADAMLEARKR